MIVEQSLLKAEIEKIKKQVEREKAQRRRFFKGKKAGKPVVIMDEFHMAFKQPSNPFPYQPTGNFDANSLVTKS